MTTHKQCPECDGTDLYIQSDIPARGNGGPDLLPGASGFFTTAKMQALVCKGCGLIRLYASQDALSKINTDSGWQKLL